MTCEEISRNEVVEQYLLGRLEPSASDEFERHYFECGRCFDRLQTLRALRNELAAQAATLRTEPSRSGGVWAWLRPWAWAPAFAVLVVAVSITFWLRPVPPGEVLEDERGRTPVGPSAGAVGEPAGRAVTPPPVTASPPPAPSGPSLAELARIQPPAYSPPTFRGAEDAATAQFRQAMRHYVRGDHRAAIPALRRASELDPEAPHVAFFLGICEILTGRVDAGIRALRKTIALGESPYLEEAHLHLAKALMLDNDVAGARRELEKTVALHGDFESEARRLRRELDRIGAPARQP